MERVELLMANRNTKRRIQAMRKAGEHFHGKACDTHGKGCNFAQPKEHVFVVARAATLKAKGWAQ
jgi:hypothetical protein